MNFAATKVTYYAVLYQELRAEAYLHGYALALHGSLQKDLDVVAIPWVAGAASEETLVKALCEKASGCIIPGGQFRDGQWHTVTDPGWKPHGRKAYTILLMGHDGGYVDLSVMPCQGALQ